MTSKIFNLALYPVDPPAPTPQIEIRGAIIQQKSALGIHFNVTDINKSISWPNTTRMNARANELWKHTCFECFLKHPTRNEYWEFNFSSNGRWNCFHFSDYRCDMQEEPAISQCDIRFIKTATGAESDISVNLHSLALQYPLAEFLVGITMVVELHTGSINYYALTHVGQKPDFHRHESFIHVLN